MTVLTTNVEENDRAMATDGTTKSACIFITKVSFTTIIVFVSLHDSDQDDVVRISVDLSCML